MLGNLESLRHPRAADMLGKDQDRLSPHLDVQYKQGVKAETAGNTVSIGAQLRTMITKTERGFCLLGA